MVVIIMRKKDLIFRIIFLTLFLIFSTIFVYMPKKAEYAGAMAFLTSMDFISIEEVTDGIIFTYPYPVDDEIGMTGEDTIFTVKNYDDKEIKYIIKMETFEENKSIDYIDINCLKYSYRINDGNYSKPLNINSDGILDVRTISGNKTNTYYFKFWLDINNDNSIYGSSINVAISLDNFD